MAESTYSFPTNSVEAPQSPFTPHLKSNNLSALTRETSLTSKQLFDGLPSKDGTLLKAQ